MFAIDTSYHSMPRSKSRFSRLSASLVFHQKHTDLGHAGENLAIAMFEDLGFKAYKTTEKQCGDIAVVCRKTGELRRIEVKTSTACIKTKSSWQFCINKGQKTSCRHADFVLLFAVDAHKVFAYLVPSAFFGKIACIKIPSHPTKYRGKLAPFLVRGSINFDAAKETYQLGLLQ